MAKRIAKTITNPKDIEFLLHISIKYLLKMNYSISMDISIKVLIRKWLVKSQKRLDMLF